jgi:hypothetical protein
LGGPDQQREANGFVSKHLEIDFMDVLEIDEDVVNGGYGGHDAMMILTVVATPRQPKTRVGDLRFV